MKACKQLWGRGWEAGPFRRSPSSQGGPGRTKLALLSQLPALSGSLTWLLPRRANGLPS